MEITDDLVRRLIDAQFPHWSGLPVTPVPRQGHDNRTFRLGTDLAVRLPSHERYVAGISKEDAVLPGLAAHLDLAVPAPVATGAPDVHFPFPWSVRRWLDGETPDQVRGLDRTRLAHDLGLALRDLRAAPTHGGPLGGAHSFHRGCHPSAYGHEVQEALVALDGEVDVEACRDIWRRAVRSAWDADPVWVHGDVAVGNLLVDGDGLAALIDFGTCAVGDPACDLVIAWTYLDADERAVFRAAVDVDEDAWDRGRGWALWKALVTDPESPQYDVQRRALAELLSEAA